MKSSVPNLSWPPAPDLTPLSGRDVHVWAASLAVSPEALGALGQTLSADERERASRFKFEQHRNRYIAGRGILRSVLSRYSSTPPASFTFQYSRHGKPELSEKQNPQGLHFNLAHSGDMALLAVTRLGPVGVDVEQVRPVKEMDDLVARFFSVREAGLFQALPEAGKPAAFFNLWTRKEAFLKATGEGITGGLNRVEVSFLPGEPARFLALGEDAESARRWTLLALEPAAGFPAAIAVHAGNVTRSCWRWTPAGCSAGINPGSCC